MIENFYTRIPQEGNRNKHSIFELPFRMLGIGPSGSGKTNAALNILKSMNGIFVDVTVVTKNSSEPLYQFLKDKLKEMCILCEGIENTPQVDSFDKAYPHLVIFDDMINEKNQKAIVEFYVRARKLNVSVLYLSQSFYQTPKMIRQNVGYLFIKKLSSMNDLARIIRECSLTESKEEVLEMYKLSTKDKFGWLMIDLQKSRYLNGFELIKDVNATTEDDD